MSQRLNASAWEQVVANVAAHLPMEVLQPHERLELAELKAEEAEKAKSKGSSKGGKGGKGGAAAPAAAEEEKPKKVFGMNSITEAEILEQHAMLYVHYVRSYRQLAEAADQMVHPQKRAEAVRLMDALVGRLIEVKSVLMRMQQKVVVDLDDTLDLMRLTPQALDLPPPNYALNARRAEIENREQLLSALLLQYEQPQERPASNTRPQFKMGAGKPVRAIGKRRGSKQAPALTLEEEIARAQAQAEASKDSTMSPDHAATLIQSLFRGHYARKQHAKQQRELRVTIGMDHKDKAAGLAAEETLTSTRKSRLRAQHQHEQEHESAIPLIREKLEQKEGPEVREQMQDDIRRWFMKEKEENGAFPAFPTRGSDLVAPAADTPSPEELAAQEKRAAELAEKRAAAKAAKGGNQAEAPKKAAKPSGDMLPEPDLAIPQSKFLETLHESVATYERVWMTRNEDANFAQKHDEELVKEELRPEIHAAIRLKVDDEMEDELIRLKQTVEGKKSRKNKPRGPKENKKPPAPKPRKGDLTADRSTESLFAELVAHRFVRRPEAKYTRDYKGEGPAAAARNLCVEWGMLPLSSEAVHQGGSAAKVLLLYGPKGTGKTHLAHAVAHETASSFFDLSPQNVLRSSYKQGEDIRMLVHMVFKVAEVMQPSVIFFGDVEQMFGGPIPTPPPEVKVEEAKAEGEGEGEGEGGEAAPKVNPDTMLENEPEVSPKSRVASLKKWVLSQTRQIKPGMRVLLVATSSEPWAGRPLPGWVNSSSGVGIPTQLPTYEERSKLWYDMLRGVKLTDDIDTAVAVLTKVSEGFSQAQIVSIFQNGQDENSPAEKQQVSTESLVEKLSQKLGDNISAKDLDQMAKFGARLTIKSLPSNAPEAKKK